jgi:hypothetical protein
MICIYYVYAYIRRSNGLPYYIGKGKNKRAYEQHRGITVPKDKSMIVFLETNLTELGAFALERRYIKWYGRKNIGTGILRNQTDGGDGGDTSKSKAWIASFNKRKERPIYQCKTGPRQGDSLETRLKKKTTQIGMKVWNNGAKTKRCKTCPGDGWTLGRLDKSPKAICISYDNKTYPSIQKAIEDTGASFYTIKKYSTRLEPSP